MNPKSPGQANQNPRPESTDKSIDERTVKKVSICEHSEDYKQDFFKILRKCVLDTLGCANHSKPALIEKCPVRRAYGV